MEKMYRVLEQMSDHDILRIWECLRVYDPTEMYDRVNNITMDEWANAVYMEKFKRDI